MTERPRRRVVSLWLPGLATTNLWRPTAASPDDETLVHAIRRTERLAAWCGRYTPWTSLDDTGGVWLDITGCQHLFGGERAMLEDITARIAGYGLEVRACVADTPGAAWALARFGGADPFVLSEPGAHRELMTRLPLAALRIGMEAAESLRRVGLRRIGDLYPLARAPIAARFGEDVLARLDQALGRRDEPLSPLRPPPGRRVRMSFPDPIGLTDDLWAAFERLLEALLLRLRQAAEGAVQVDLTGYRCDGTVTELSIGLGQASRDAQHIRRLMREKFDTFEAGFGIEAMALAAAETEHLSPSQRALSGADTAAEHLVQLMDRLSNRLGQGGPGGVACTERHVPERASAAVAPDAVSGVPEDAPTLPRPMHLLSPPEAVEALAPVPDGPPVMFKWRRRTHRVTLAEGPERIASEWWLEDPARLASGAARVRDYYRVEDDTGARYWVFRAGLYQSDKPPRWYMHGVFS